MIIFFITNLPLVSAQVISVTSDKECYSGLDKITFSGIINVGIQGDQVNIKIEANKGDFETLVSARADSTGNFKTIPFKAGDRLHHLGTFTAYAFIQDPELNKKITFSFLSSCQSSNSGETTPPSITFQSSLFTLQIDDGSSDGNIIVYPELTTSSGSKIPAAVSIFVDGNYITSATSNQWSSNIFTGSDYHTILASVPEMTSPFDSSVKYLTASDTETYFVVNQSKDILYDTSLSLRVADGSSQGNIKVYPELTYGSSNPLSIDSVEIYVDGNYKTKLSSNQWSNDIWAGSGTHTIKVSVGESYDDSDSSIKFKEASNSVTFFVQTSSGVLGNTSDEVFPIEYVIAVIAIAAIAGLVIALSKRKKATPKVMVSPAKTPSPFAPQAITQDDTQFWVCPHCGGDTQYRSGKQYCDTCKIFL